jgi:eukaryotic-like serine/threonine-protein kinase
MTAPQDTAPEADLTGQTLGDFQVLRLLGRGGMGQVYLAEQISLKRKVALKLLKPELASNPVSLKRFKAEAEAVARVTHANIVQVFAVGEVNGLHFMALEFVEGRNLREYLERRGPPELLVALSIMRQVAAALQRASELGVIHRDIKPENILLTRKGEAKVADFGLSRCFADDVQPLKLTESGVAMGTPLYMSPEQVEGRPVDPRSDIYSFGVTCYHMLAGQPPFRGQSAVEVAIQHVQKEPVPLARIRPDLPAELCSLVHKMMVKDPDQRFQTGKEVIREVARLRDALVGVTGTRPALTTQTLAVGPTAPLATDVVPTRTIPAYSPRRRLWIPAVLSVLAALAVGFAFGWQSLEPPGPPLKEPKNPAEEKLRRKIERLREDFQEHSAKAEDKAALRRGLEDAIDLSVLLLNERRLDEADQFFKELDDPKKVRNYRLMGQVGRAVSLAFQDRAKESNDSFLKLFPHKPKPKGNFAMPPFWLLHPRLRELIAEALNHNAANLTDSPFPPTLERLRRPPLPLR